ncbi:MAG: Crp/Fnr family transcriptional regulator [Verrucomicrobia bacterium]|nr:Crp/Fnr family transcriptional regulator [Verrucomicrobiota bacterium]
MIAGLLRACMLFSGLPVVDITLVASFSRLVRVGRGEYLYRRGESGAGFYIVQEGAISLHRVSPSGREHTIRVFRPGQVLGEAALVMPGGYIADAKAVEDSLVILVAKNRFVKLLGRHPELGLRMLGSMSGHLRVLVGLIEDFQCKDVETRLANWFLRQCPTDGTSIRLRLPKGVLAGEMGTTIETLSRTFAKFRDAGWITVKAQEITVHSRAGLEGVLEKNLGG